MKREPERTIILYILTFVLFFLIAFLIHFIISYDTKDKKDDKTCNFESSVNEYNYFMNGNQMLSLCDGYNNISVNIKIGNKLLKAKAVIYNGDDHEITAKDGLFINGDKISNDTYTSGFSNFYLVGNILYVIYNENGITNVLAYDDSGSQVYNLDSTLSELQITDSSFVEIAKTDNTIDPVITGASLESGSFSFDETGFTFNSYIGRECNVGELYTGSNYKVSYDNGKFGVPTFVDYIKCGK